MNPAIIRTKVTLSLLSILAVIGLSSCVRANVSIDIQPNGSGIVSASLGMTRQAETLLSDDGAPNLIQDIEQRLATRSGSVRQDVDVRRWRDGDYDTVSVTSEFASVEEISETMTHSEIFTRFSLSRKPGFLWNAFILDAELPSLIDEMSMEDTIDPTAFIKLDIAVRLPGRIMESNGLVAAHDPNLMSWTAQGYTSVSMRARSIVLNWPGVLALGGVAS